MRGTILRALLVISLLAAGAACSLPLSNIVLTTQVDSTGKALNASNSFTIDTPSITCSVDVGGLSPSSRVAVEWLDFENQQWKSFHQDSATVASATYIPFTVVAPDTGWETGDYTARVLVNDKEVTEKRFSIVKDASVALPVINNFTATPSQVTAGQPLTLSWQVTGASRVVISPEVGNVDTGGSRLVSPAADTSYTITALNSGGSTSSTLNVKVVAPVSAWAHLYMINIFRQAQMVYYTIGNSGPVASNASSSKMYVGSSVVTNGYIPPLAAGEQRTLQFGSFVWSYLFTTPVTVCIDTANENNEANAQDTCMTALLAGVRYQP